MKFVEAIQKALGDALDNDPSVVLLGEDIAVDGGVFRATDGLYDKYGSERVIDTPIAETSIAGVAVGLASQGMKPVAEIQFMGFSYACLDQMVNHASRLRNRTRGRLTCPMVLRIPYGGGIHAPEHHSESNEAMFAHIPGLRVVVPSSPTRAYGLLLGAIQNPDPVVFLEPKRLYQTQEADASLPSKALALDKAHLLTEGSDITLISWGAMVVETIASAKTLQAEGIEAEVIDVCSLSLLDESTIYRSVKKTGRCVVIHEAVRSGGFGAEISARLSEDCMMSLKAPILRVTSPDCVVPLPKLESNFMPNQNTIVGAARQLMEYA